MPLETATYIHELEPANPAGTDQLAQGDDHLRLIKAALQATFPNLAGPVTKTDAELNAAAFIVPVGLITIWYGSSGTVPAGWAVCNGQTVSLSAGGGTIATPDLRDRAVVGAGALAAQGVTAGAATAAATSGVAGAHAHTIAGGAHTHTVSVGSSSAGGTLVTTDRTVDGSGGATVLQSASFTEGAAHTHTATAESATHTHTVSSEGDHQHSVTVSTIQPVMGLHYIMKV